MAFFDLRKGAFVLKVWKKKSFWVGIVLLVALSVVAILIIHRELDGQNLPALLRQADFRFLLLCILFMGVYAVCDTWNLQRCLRLFGNQVGFFQTLRYVFAGFFFSSITPSSTGGQPSQLYFFSRDGISLSHGTFSLLCALLSFQLVSVTFGIVGAFFVLFSDLLSI